MDRGLLRERVLKSRPCALASEPAGTLSQIVAYESDGNRIALVHRYLRPDGSIGASGRPDPKELLEDGILYYV